MTTARPEDQHALLDVQQLDLRLTQINHRLTALPEQGDVDKATKAVGTLRDRLVAAETNHADIERKIRGIEGDIEQVKTRRTREQAKLDSGDVPPKALETLQGDIAHLDRRLDELETSELELMEMGEKVSATLGNHRDNLSQAEAVLTKASATKDVAAQQLERERDDVSGRREQAAAGLPDPLMGMYNDLRLRLGGVGAAPLVGRRCEGCRMDLTQGDLEVFRAAGKDEVLQCPECDRILVRVEQSAL